MFRGSDSEDSGDDLYLSNLVGLGGVKFKRPDDAPEVKRKDISSTYQSYNTGEVSLIFSGISADHVRAVLTDMAEAQIPLFNELRRGPADVRRRLVGQPESLSGAPSIPSLASDIPGIGSLPLFGILGLGALIGGYLLRRFWLSKRTPSDDPALLETDVAGPDSDLVSEV